MGSSTIIEKAWKLQWRIEAWIERRKKSWKEHPNIEFSEVRVLKYIPFINQLYIEKREGASKFLREIFVLWFVVNQLGGVSAFTFWNLFKWLNYLIILHVLALGWRLDDVEAFFGEKAKNAQDSKNH